MTIEIKPEVKAATDQRLQSGSFHDVDELLMTALSKLPEDRRFDRDVRREAVRRMKGVFQREQIEFGRARDPRSCSRRSPLLMSAFVLDASVAVSWSFPDDLSENTPFAPRVLDLLEEADALVPEV